jgi:FMN phosphatase YigB (HAD superfamily)
MISAILMVTSAMAVGPIPDTTAASLSVIYFDLGNTLVKRDPDGPRRVWISGAPQVLTRLHEAGFRLGVLSNTGPLTWDEVLTTLLPADFDPSLFDPELIVVSSAVGAEKPDPRIFQFAITQTRLPAGEILFVTETMDHVLAAQASGMRALWILEGGLSQMANDLIATTPTTGG